MKPLVSIIVAAYNEEDHIATCLDSLRKQTYEPKEIIVVDDGSTDKTRDIVKNYLDIQLLHVNHQGTALSRNFAAQQAAGEILVFVDGDMEFAPDFIDKLVAPINKNKTKGTFSKLEYVANWDKPLARCWNRQSGNLPDKLRVPHDQDEGEDFRAILKSEFMRVKGFDNTGYTDTWSLAKKLGYKPVNAPDAVYYHKNPQNFAEIFKAAQWIGKREYKLGRLGSIVAIVRAFPLISPLKGVLKALKHNELNFIPFQIVYDWGITVGALNKIFFNSVIK